MTGTEIRVLLLDADGVVQTTGPGWRAALAALCPDPAATDDFLADVFAAERPCLTGAVDFEPALGAVLERWRSTASTAEALAIWELIEPQAQLLALVDELRATGLRVSLATNQQHRRAGFMAHGLGYVERFDDLFFSCHLGCAKPGATYFETVRDALGVQAAQVLFVDDHEVNVAAARESGFNAEVYSLESGLDGMFALLGRHGIRSVRP